MTTEQDFQTALDQQVDSWQTRLVFADWLEEQGDKRAAGYRALGRLKSYPEENIDSTTKWGWTHHGHEFKNPMWTTSIPTIWFDKIYVIDKDRGYSSCFYYDQDTRAETENLAALKFLELTEDEKLQILSVEDL
jgi:uncharacterized protein (TIGR02996 family)